MYRMYSVSVFCHVVTTQVASVYSNVTLVPIDIRLAQMTHALGYAEVLRARHLRGHLVWALSDWCLASG